MADSDAALYTPTPLSAVHTPPRSEATVGEGESQIARHMQPRSVAAVYPNPTLGVVATYKMLGYRTTPPTGPVTWNSPNSPDPSGALYEDGPAALDPARISIISVF